MKFRPRIAVSGVEFDRHMRMLFGGPDGIRTIIFPSMLRTIKQSAFSQVGSLRKAVLNEGLEVLGTNELTPDGKLYPGVFFVSGLRNVKFPSTLKRIEYRVFMGCRNLKTVCLPEGLEYLGEGCF